MTKTSGKTQKGWAARPFLDALGQSAACRDLSGRAVRQLAALQVDLDVPSPEMPSDELLGKRILDIALDGAAERARSIRTILAGEIDDPVHDFRQERDLQLPAHEILVELVDQQQHDLPQLIVAQ